MSGPTPFLDFFKRGEVPKDVRLLAAQGAIAPRAHEQLAILVLLLDDIDPEIRNAAEHTLNRIPVAALQVFLARSDVSIGLREFFADRGIFPDEIPTIEMPQDPDTPFVDTTEPTTDASEDFFAEEGQAANDSERKTALQMIGEMGFTDRLKAAVKGSKEMRAILIRDTNKMISAAVMSSPKITTQEIESFARMGSVSEDVLRTIGNTRAWMKNYNVVVALTKNPKTPLAMSMNLMARLQDKDLSMLSVDRNVPEALRIAARKKVVAATSKK